MPECLPSEAASARGHEKPGTGPALEDLPPGGIPIPSYRLQRLSVCGNQALLIAFARGAHETQIELHVAHPQMAQFGNTQSRGVQQFQHGPVAHPGWFRFVGSVQELLYLAAREKMWNGLPLLGRLDVLCGVALYFPFGEQETVVTAKRGKVAGNRAAP